ncbi:hypothetical protein F511_04443 [Dorcoceras hygrometricum]|uniref:Uncharacterized protein n=1 Tax=Dorcoceras hygrometricum TaxID=472368 RepID=A0A2Z7CWT0_9LAMI|nr:hypothetical protein F511_04443 [Dorcoceras hygrometricum]
MPPRRPNTRQTVFVPPTEQTNVQQPVSVPGLEQGSTSATVMDVTITPMETLLKRFQSFKRPTLKGTENSVDCENFLEDIEQLFDSLDYSENRRIRLVVHQLHEVAKSWWITTSSSDQFKSCLVVLICEYQGACFEDERVTPVYLIFLLGSVSRYERSG